MRYIIDDDILEKNNVSTEVLLYLLALYKGKEINYNTFEKSCKEGYVSYDKFNHFTKQATNLKLSQKGIEFVEDIILNSEFKEANKSKDRFDLLAEKLRELFPKGKKEGTNYMWRDSNAIIARRLKAIVKKYNAKFTDEQAIEATKRYIKSFNGDYRYMQLLKYFISKQIIVDNTVTEVSQLLSYIENTEEDEFANNNWVDNLV